MPAKRETESNNKGRWGSRRSTIKGSAEPQSRGSHKTTGSKRPGRTSRTKKA